MTGLAWANIKHRKLRSALASLAVAIGVAMLVTMLALSHGTLEEVAQRVKGIDAELIVLPSQSSLIFSEGAPLSDKFEPKIRAVTVDGRPVIKEVVPVYLAIMPQMAGQQQRVFAVDTEHFAAFYRNQSFTAGRLFDADGQFRKYLDGLRGKTGTYLPDQVSEEKLNQACELVIDSRLARAGNYRLGDNVSFLGRDFRICGIIEAGAAGRVFAPIQVVRHLQNCGLRWSSLFFIKLDPAVVDVDDRGSGGKISVAACAAAITEATHLKVASLREYDQMLFNSFRPIYIYINIASALVLIVSFLFIMVTIYTMVLERRREIGILRSMGATGTYIMGQTISEALIISSCGMVAGLVMSFGAKWAIEHFRPLLTVDLRPHWLILGVGVGLVGGLVSALYPGLCALRQDPLAALGYE